MTGILDGLTALITDALSPKASDELVAWLDDFGIANAKMRTMAKFSAHPQLAARNRWVQVDTPGGLARWLLPPVTAATYVPAMAAVPALGQHTEQIRQEFGATLRKD